MNTKIYEFKAIIQKVSDIDGAYIQFPYNVKTEFGKGRVKVMQPLSEVPYVLTGRVPRRLFSGLFVYIHRHAGLEFQGKFIL